MPELTIRRLSGYGDGVNPYVLVMDTLPYKDAIRWTKICARCLATKCDRIDVFLRRGGVEYLLRSEAVADADDSTGIRTEVIATGDYKVCARFSTPGATSECELYAYGVVQQLYPRE